MKRSTGENAGVRNAEEDLIVRAAWLYYTGGHRQETVARTLGVSRFKVNRLLAQARELGIVRISIEHETVETLAMGSRIAERFGLRECLVAPPVSAGGPDDDGARRAVAETAAVFLQRRLSAGPDLTVGVGWGRTIAALADALRVPQPTGTRFVSLMGSLTRNAATNPFDVVQRLAQRTGGESFLLPAPFIADSVEDAEVFASQRSVREALSIARGADFHVVSVGECNRDSLLFTEGLIAEEEIAELMAAEAVCDTIGKFFNADGVLVDSTINHRTAGIELQALHDTETVLLAAGTGKAVATRGMLRVGIVDVLVVDHDTASLLLDGAG